MVVGVLVTFVLLRVQPTLFFGGISWCFGFFGGAFAVGFRCFVSFLSSFRPVCPN